MKFYLRCFYALLIVVLILIISAVVEQDKQEEVKYHSGLPYNDVRGTTVLSTKARDGALSGLIMGTLSGGPGAGLIMAGKYGLVGPIVGGVNYLRNTDATIIKK